MRIVLLLACVAVAGFGQGIRFPFDPELKRFLELTDEQVSRIETNNGNLTARLNEESARMRGLSFQAGQELAKPSPDPMVVGGFYAEQERLCRGQLRASAETRELNRAVLTEAQRQKLAALQESARLVSVVAEAQSANLYRPPIGDFFASFLLGGVGGTAGSGFGFVSDLIAPSRCGGFPGGVIPISRIVLP